MGKRVKPSERRTSRRNSWNRAFESQRSDSWGDWIGLIDTIEKEVNEQGVSLGEIHYKRELNSGQEFTHEVHFYFGGKNFKDILYSDREGNEQILEGVSDSIIGHLRGNYCLLNSTYDPSRYVLFCTIGPSLEGPLLQQGKLFK